MIYRGLSFKGVILLAGLFMPAMSVAQYPVWMESEYVRDAFYRVAFFNEFNEGKERRLLKWTSPLHIHIFSAIGDPELHEKMIQEQMNILTEHTQLPMYIEPEREHANVLIYFMNQTEFYRAINTDKNPHLSHSLCTFNILADRNGQIVKAWILIPEDLARSYGRLQSCVIEEMTQIMGLTNDVDDLYPSIFNDSSIFQQLTPLDKYLLHILYDERLQPGVNWNDVLDIIYRVIHTQIDDPHNHTEKTLYLHTQQ